MVRRWRALGAIAGSVLLFTGCSLETNAPDPDVITRRIRANSLAWIDQTSKPLASIEPTANDADLAPLDAMVEAAHVVGMGNDTYGAHEAFALERRVFQHLVEHMGFTALGIEATMPEAFALDDYVRTGRGDPAALVSRLFAWNWKTSELLDLIAWIRQHNATVPADQQVGFYGFDVPAPAGAIDSVVAYVRRVAPVLAPAEEDDYSCLSTYRNDQAGVFEHDYSKATTLWPFCTPRVADAYNALVANRATLEAGSSPAQFARALQLARVVVQWESVERGAMARDAAMAENATWILQHANGGAQSKVFLWAHNAHVGRIASTSYASMGAYLSTLLLTNYLPIGFAFGSGSFNAQGIDGSGNITPTVRVMTTSAPRTGSFEEVLQSSRNSAFYFDMRQDTPDDVTSWLVGPEWLRVVGTAYDPTAPDSFFQPANLTGLVDVMVFVRTVTPTRLVGQ